MLHQAVAELESRDAPQVERNGHPPDVAPPETREFLIAEIRIEDPHWRPSRLTEPPPDVLARGLPLDVARYVCRRMNERALADDRCRWHLVCRSSKRTWGVSAVTIPREERPAFATDDLAASEDGLPVERVETIDEAMELATERNRAILDSAHCPRVWFVVGVQTRGGAA